MGPGNHHSEQVRLSCPFPSEFGVSGDAQEGPALTPVSPGILAAALGWEGLQREGWRQGSCQRDQRKHALTSHGRFLTRAFISEGSNSTNYALTFISPCSLVNILPSCRALACRVTFAAGHNSVVGRHRRSRSPCPVIAGSQARCSSAMREGISFAHFADEETETKRLTESRVNI